MPHIFLNLEPQNQDFFQPRDSWVIRESEQDLTLKFMGLYAAPGMNTYLFRVLVVEGRLNQHFYLQLAKRKQSEAWLLGLDHHGAVIRTAGVKKMIATLGAWVVSRCNGSLHEGNLDSEWQWALTQNLDGLG